MLFQRKESHKLSFEGKVVEIKKVDTIYIAIVAIGQQLVEVVLSKEEQKRLEVGEHISLSAKAFQMN